METNNEACEGKREDDEIWEVNRNTLLGKNQGNASNVSKGMMYRQKGGISRQGWWGGGVLWSSKGSIASLYP